MNIKNIGPKSEKLLGEIGVLNMADLKALGAVEVYARLRFQFGRQVNRNFLHALDAALAGCSWRELSAERKAELDWLVAEHDA